MLVLEGVICNACCFFLFKNTQKLGGKFQLWRQHELYSETSLAKLLTGSKRRDGKAVRQHEVRGYGIFPHTSKILFLPKSRPCTRILIFLKTEIFSLFKYLKNMSPEVV